MERCASPSPPRQHRHLSRAYLGPELQFPKRIELRSRAQGTTYSPCVGEYESCDGAARDIAGKCEVVGKGEKIETSSRVHAAGCEDERNFRTKSIDTTDIAGK